MGAVGLRVVNGVVFETTVENVVDCRVDIKIVEETEWVDEAMADFVDLRQRAQPVSREMADDVDNMRLLELLIIILYYYVLLNDTCPNHSRDRVGKLMVYIIEMDPCIVSLKGIIPD